jgi:hypothetical protein
MMRRTAKPQLKIEEAPIEIAGIDVMLEPLQFKHEGDRASLGS